MPFSDKSMTVGEFKRLLKDWPDDWIMTFSSVLQFYRLKKRGDKLVDVEFSQTVWRDFDGEWYLQAHNDAVPERD